MNELLLIVSLLLIFGAVVLFLKIFGKNGLYVWTVIATITANIEVLIQVDAFGMSMTLGNILFASTFLVTDILSEIYSKKDAKRAVTYGIATNISFIVISQTWLFYTPNETDFAFPSIQTIFSNTPRIMLSSLVVYIICQYFDVWLYHKWWEITEKKSGKTKPFLWLRNNGSTLVSQLLNTFLYNFFAFYGMEGFDLKYTLMISLSGYVIFIVTSLADTPFIYFARRMMENKTERDES